MSDLLDVCIARLGKFKTPDTIHFMDELPKGPSGKIQRLKLAELTT
jgi:acyl-coenzyme A synthetase/AMP-(fatty) acid ligase